MRRLDLIDIFGCTFPQIMVLLESTGILKEVTISKGSTVAQVGGGGFKANINQKDWIIVTFVKYSYPALLTCNSFFFSHKKKKLVNQLSSTVRNRKDPDSQFKLLERFENPSIERILADNEIVLEVKV